MVLYPDHQVLAVLFEYLCSPQVGDMAGSISKQDHSRLYCFGHNFRLYLLGIRVKQLQDASLGGQGIQGDRLNPG